MDNEIKILELIKEKGGHPGLIAIKDVVREDLRLGIVMEMLRGKELFERIVERKHYNEGMGDRLS